VEDHPYAGGAQWEEIERGVMNEFLRGKRALEKRRPREKKFEG